MNRDILSVVLTPANPNANAAAAGGAVDYGEHSETSVPSLTQQMLGAKRVVIVPGYGLAVAKAQYAVAEMVSLLQSQGVEVAFGVHPVAGRMPGQLNVLLAEAGVPYDCVLEVRCREIWGDRGRYSTTACSRCGETQNRPTAAQPSFCMLTLTLTLSPSP